MKIQATLTPHGHTVMQSCIPLVYHIAKKFARITCDSNPGMDFNDVLSELSSAGMEGLTKAALVYDKHRAKFTTVAYWWIYESVTKEVPKFHRIGRLFGTHKMRGKNKNLFPEVVGTVFSLGYSGEDRMMEIDVIDKSFQRQKTQEFKEIEVKKLLRKIPNRKDRRMFEMKYLEEMTLVEIGKKYKLSKERVRQRINRAMQQVRECCHEV